MWPSLLFNVCFTLQLLYSSQYLPNYLVSQDVGKNLVSMVTRTAKQHKLHSSTNDWYGGSFQTKQSKNPWKHSYSRISKVFHHFLKKSSSLDVISGLCWGKLILELFELNSLFTVCLLWCYFNLLYIIYIFLSTT